MSCTREKMVERVKSWLGRNEADGSHKEIIDIYNAHKPLARGYKVKYTDPWCATNVSACAIECKATDIIPTECSCGEMIKRLKKIGAWEEKDSYVPSPGDILFYDWDDNGNGDNTGAPEHVGIVEKVVGNKITIIEGNYQNSVKRRVIGINSKYIRGYGVPAYKKKSISKTKVVATDYAKSKDKKLAGAYTVTASSLNIRHGAGTNKKVMASLPEGTTVRNYGFYTQTSSGMKWLYVEATCGNVIYTGFCSQKYLTKKG